MRENDFILKQLNVSIKIYQVEKVMNIGRLAVRLIHNQKTGEFWYSTFDGNVFRISDFDTPKAKEHQVFSAENHGITRLQGAVFLNIRQIPFKQKLLNALARFELVNCVLSSCTR